MTPAQAVPAQGRGSDDAHGGAAGRAEGRLGVLAGNGGLPLEVAAAARDSGNDPYIVALEEPPIDQAGPTLTDFQHTRVSIGQVGSMIDALRSQGCARLVIIGGVTRPDLRALKVDLGFFTNLPRVLELTIGGDNTLLGNVIRFFEDKGLTVVGAHEVAPALLAGAGALGRREPSKADLKDLDKARCVVDALGLLDVGQGAVVARDYVLAVEAAEGTDRMLSRCAELRPWGGGMLRRRIGVFYKGPKPGQELRVDMPVIGPATIAKAAAAGLAGIGLSSGHVLMADKQRTIEAADAAGLFLYGMG